ncbi:MAG: hypothetical protein LRY54_03740 [Alphaproteobacteria bacterium]|nr:hypothetical protein [Alphaproteobacteria bacterium]
MFGNITNFAQTRSYTEAFGFFLFYTVLLVGLSTFLGHYMTAFGIWSGDVGNFFDGSNTHTMIGAGWVMVMSAMILQARKMTSDLMSVLIAAVGVYLAYSVDVLAGMVVVSYLTTLGK